MKESTSSVVVFFEVVLICSWIFLCLFNCKVQGRQLVKKSIAEGDFTIKLLRIAVCFHSVAFSWGWFLAIGAQISRPILNRFVAAIIFVVAVWTALYLQIWSVHLAQAPFKGRQTLIHRRSKVAPRYSEAPTSSCRIFVG